MFRNRFTSPLLIFCTFCFFSIGLSSFKNPPTYKLIVFQGSDWCKQCINFENNILSDSLVIEKMNSWQIEIEKIDFPQRKKLSKEQRNYNKKIADQYQFDGAFPTVIITKSDQADFSKIIYSQKDTSSDFLNKIKSALDN